MKKENLALIIFAILFLFPCQSKALTIQSVKEVACGKEIRFLVWGCYARENDYITVKDNLGIITIIRTIIHELGHYKMKDIQDYSLFEKTEVRNSMVLTSTSEEKAAEMYVNYIVKNIMVVVVSKPYVRYYGSYNVYNYHTGEKITYDFAVKNNIWNDTQDLPFVMPLPTFEQEKFFDALD